MSGAKYASLTAGLLVRKGEAAPSPITPPPALYLASAPQRPEAPFAPFLVQVPRENAPPAAAPVRRESEKAAPCERASRSSADRAPPPPDHPEKPRRLMATLTPAEYGTLGLIAVKKGVTRHQLLRNALDEYMALLVEEFGGDCQCIYTGCSCGVGV